MQNLSVQSKGWLERKSVSIYSIKKKDSATSKNFLRWNKPSADDFIQYFKAAEKVQYFCMKDSKSDWSIPEKRCLLRPVSPRVPTMKWACSYIVSQIPGASLSGKEIITSCLTLFRLSQQPTTKLKAVIKKSTGNWKNNDWSNVMTFQDSPPKASKEAFSLQLWRRTKTISSPKWKCKISCLRKSYVGGFQYCAATK